MKNDNCITQDEVKKLLHYNPDTGEFRWLIPAHGRRRNRKAGSLVKNRMMICIDYTDYFVHRLAFLYMTGKFPTNEVDHINHDPTDNRWCNLREASRSSNEANKVTRNRWGYKGVKKIGNRFYASIRISGASKYLGSAATAYEASLLYNAKASEIFGEFACTGSNAFQDGKKSVDASVESEIQAVRIEQNHL